MDRCIPYRYKNNGTQDKEIEVLLISAQKGNGMQFPKGGWEKDESMEQAALRETIEEAGVVGSVEVSKNFLDLSFFLSSSNNICVFDSYFLLYYVVFLQGKLGKWYYKSKRQPTIHEGYMFPLLVSKELDNWPEMNTRKRRWVSVYDLVNFAYIFPIAIKVLNHDCFGNPRYYKESQSNVAE